MATTKATKKESADTYQVPTHVTKAHLDSIAANRRAFFLKNRTKLTVLSVLFFAGALLAGILAATAGTVGQALLYIFAFNGKMSGRMDGNVLMRNGRGRGYATPALVRNSYTMTQRGIFSILSAGYRGLTAAQIDAWRNAELGATDRFGRAITVKGKELYIRLNANLIDIGGVTITDPPTFGSVPSIDNLTITADASSGAISAAFATSPTDGNVTHLVFATAVLSNGVTRPSASAYRLIDIIPPGTVTPYALNPQYQNKFGTILGRAGEKIFVQLYGVNAVTGQKVPSVGTSAVIVP